MSEPAETAVTDRATISVALCTYNGSRFLNQQLTSISRQKRLPDELVICDDGSTDSTLAMARAFAKTAPFPVELHVNDTNLGSIRNFEKALKLCRGELIALSDQDDVWYSDRLGRSEQELLHHPNAGMVFTDGDVIDDEGRRLQVRLWENFELEGSRKQALQAGNFIPMARRRFVTGATVMLRASYLPWCFPVGEGWVHDGWIAAMIASMSAIRMIDEPLIAYRRHHAQQIGLGPGRPLDTEKTTLELMAKRHWSSFTNIRDDLEQICKALNALPFADALPVDGAASAFHRHHDFLAMRIGLPENRLARLPIILRASESYTACAMGWLSMAKDFVLPKPPRIEYWKPPPASLVPSAHAHE